MYCSQCGMELPDDASFCSACGSRVLPDEALRYTVTFLRYDAAGPELTMVLPDGERVTLTGRDRKSVSLPGGTQTLTLNAGPQQETLEVSLAADTQVDLYWTSEENRFLAVLESPPSSTAESASSPSVTTESKSASPSNEVWATALAQVDRNRDIVAGVLELAAACLLLFLPVVSIDSFVGSISINLMKFSELIAAYLYASSMDTAMWGMMALIVSWVGIFATAVSGIAALVKPSKLSYTLYINQSGPLLFLLALILYYVISAPIGFTPSIGLWLALGLSAGAWVAGWKNFKLVREALWKASKK